MGMKQASSYLPRWFAQEFCESIEDLRMILVVRFKSICSSIVAAQGKNDAKMMVNLERTGLRVGRTIDRRHPGRICSLAGAGQALAAIASFGALYLAWAITGSLAQATGYTIFG